MNTIVAIHWETNRPNSICQVSQTCSNWVGSFILVRVGRLELPASSSQSWRAANCATPGYLIFYSPGSFRGFFVSVGIPVVKPKFPAKSTPRQSDPFARVSSTSRLSLWEPWMPLSTIPKLARCQLRYTRTSLPGLLFRSRPSGQALHNGRSFLFLRNPTI